MLIGSEGLSNALASRGVHIKNVNERSGEVIWDGSDMTLDNQSPILQLTSSNAGAKNWLVSNISGFLTAIDIGTAVNPDGRSLALSEATSHKIYHEGNKPVQSDVSGTIPDANSDGFAYARRNAVWQVVPYVKASSTEINVGTENTKYITALNLKNSDYINASYDRASAIEIDAGTNYAKYVTPGYLRDSSYLSDVDKSNATEIDTGTSNAKFVTPLGLRDSGYLSAVDKASSTEVNTGTNDAKVITPLQLANSDYKKESEIQTQINSTIGTYNEHYLKKKFLSLGQWNMDSTSSVSIDHGLLAGVQDIISISVIVFTDIGTVYDFTSRPDGCDYVFANDTYIQVARTTGGFFDSADFNSTSLPTGRGRIVLEYYNF